MTQSELMQAAHTEARKFRASRPSWQPVTYREAISVGLRRVYNSNQRARFVAAAVAQPRTPKFMFLRGL